MPFRRHARPGQAPLPCTIYPLSAASVGAWAILYMRVCHASASIKLILLAGEMQQPPVNHPFCCCSIFFIFFFIRLSRSPCFIWWNSVHGFFAFYKEKWFLEEVTFLVGSSKFIIIMGMSLVNTWVCCLKEQLEAAALADVLYLRQAWSCILWSHFCVGLLRITRGLGIQLYQMSKHFSSFSTTYCFLMALPSKEVVVFCF